MNSRIGKRESTTPPSIEEKDELTATSCICGGFDRVANKELAIPEYLQSAGSRSLALSATPQSINGLVTALEAQRDNLGQSGLLLARAFEAHARTLIMLGRNDLAIILYDVVRALFQVHAPPELLSAFYYHRALALQRLGQLTEAAAEYERTINIRQRLVEDEGRNELINGLAGALINKGVVLSSLCQLREAVAEYEHAISLLCGEGPSELAKLQAIAHRNKGDALRDLGQLREAIAEYERAIRVYCRLVGDKGRHELANDLASALINKGNALRDVGQLHEAIADYEQAISIRRRLVEDEGRQDVANGLAAALMNKGTALSALGQLKEAMEDYGQAISIRQRLVEVLGRHEVAKDLAGTLINKANALRELGQSQAALAEYDRAITIFRRLLEREGRQELAHGLATALMNKGNALSALGRLQEAINEYDQAIGIWQGLENEGRREMAKCLAGAFMNKGSALRELGRLPAAVVEYERAISIRRRLVEDEGREELANDLAATLMSKGIALSILGQLQEAIREYDRAINIRQRLVEEAGRHELLKDLAAALMNKGTALRDLGQLSEAVAEFERAISIYHRLVEEEGRQELAHGLAGAFMNKGTALRDLGHLREAVAEHERAISIFRRLVEQEGRQELAHGLATAFMNKGIVLNALGQLQEAVEEYNRAINIRQRLVEKEGRHEFAKDLAAALMNKGVALRALGHFRQSVEEFEQCIRFLRRLVEEENRDELARDLAGAIMNRANALRALGQLQEAVEEFDQAISIFGRLVEEEGRQELAKDLALALINKAQALEAQGDLKKALTIYRGLNIEDFQGDSRRNYHWGIGNNLWEQGMQEEALDHLFRAMDAYSAARKIAGLDETFLEYVGQRSSFINLVVCRALYAGRNREAFACMQHGKAGVLTDLHARLSPDNEPEREEIVAARRELVSWLRKGPTRENVDAWLAEQARRAQQYLQTWRSAQSVPKTDALPLDVTKLGPAALNEIQASLQPGWAVLDFWRTAEEEVKAFVVTRDSFEVETLSFPLRSRPNLHGNLTALLELMQDPLACMEDDARNDTGLDDLHAYLFAPLRPSLKVRGIRGLYLVPQGFLHALPLHAARRRVNGEFRHLCDDFDVAYLPSAALLPRLPKPQAGRSLLSLANPDRGTVDSLPFSDWEGLQLSNLLHKEGRFLGGPDATFEATDGWDKFSTIHFSCHGMGDVSFAPFSRLYLRDDLLLAHDVIYRRPRLCGGAVVILNGCQTGVKDWRAADEGMGLMSAFLLRGAGLVLSTMWSVVDHCAAEMVLRFVAELIDQGQPPAEALRRAQIRARNLTWEEYDERSVQVLAMCDPQENAIEVGKLFAQKAWLSSRCGLVEEAHEAAQRAAPLLRRAGLELEAERLMALTRGGGVLARPLRQKPRACPFDHPIIWGAFQLVGRVT